MSKQRKDQDPPKSALHVRRGVTGGHDGLPDGSAAGRDAAERSNRTSRKPLTTAELVAGVRAGDRTILARAITLVESNAPDHFDRAQELIKELLPFAGNSVRIGITGLPGAGKSSLIETLGSQLTALGRKVAVTAIDPTSSISGGSILGDKTRMEKLATDPNAFIRPSPSGGTLGGVARKTRETLLLFEAAGYEIIFVETVGVGQSEIAVRSMVDFFLLLLVAGAGDELQGLKKGIMEIADTVCINKAAKRTRGEYAHALHFLRPATPGWRTEAFTLSVKTGDGIAELWRVVEKFCEVTRQSGGFGQRRREQERDWVHTIIGEHLQELFHRHPEIQRLLPELERAVMAGEVTATTAARNLLDAFSHSLGDSD